MATIDLHGPVDPRYIDRVLQRACYGIPHLGHVDDSNARSTACHCKVPGQSGQCLHVEDSVAEIVAEFA